MRPRSVPPLEPPQILFRVVREPWQPSKREPGNPGVIIQIKPYRFIKIILVNSVSGNLDVLDHFLERAYNMTGQRRVRLGYEHEIHTLLLNGMSVILLDECFDGRRHGRLAQQLQLLSTQEFAYQSLHSEFRNLLGE